MKRYRDIPFQRNKIQTQTLVETESKFWGVDAQGFGDFTYRNFIKVQVPWKRGSRVKVKVELIGEEE